MSRERHQVAHEFRDRADGGRKLHVVGPADVGNPGGDEFFFRRAAFNEEIKDGDGVFFLFKRFQNQGSFPDAASTGDGYHLRKVLFSDDLQEIRECLQFFFAAVETHGEGLVFDNSEILT